MKKKKNVMVQFTLITFITILLISIGSGEVLENRFRKYLISNHIEFLPRVVKHSVEDHPDFYVFLRSYPDLGPSPDVEGFFQDLLTFGSVTHVVVFGKDGTVVWSDEENSVGKNFRENAHFQQALGGENVFDYRLSRKNEGAKSPDKGVLLELYIPVYKGSEVVGVLKLLESDRLLYEQIKKNRRTVWMMVAAAGAAIYISLFLIFFRIYRSQKQISKRLLQTQDVTIFALAYQAELRDLITGRHLERTSMYVRILAEELSRDKEYRSYLTKEYIADLAKSAPLHDIGKVGVPDYILRKPGKLTMEEFEEIKKHSQLGHRIITKVEEKLTFQSFLKIAIQIILSHHEKWDGTGYPAGLAGEKIPISARIMALADVYDALRTTRPYKEVISHERSRDIILSEKGKHFDPRIVDAFINRETDFHFISRKFADDQTDPSLTDDHAKAIG
jgi:HD-GYP domain-containing protein (c-di-GMP phosphodiesterase class II)